MIINDCCAVYFLCHKSEVFENIKKFEAHSAIDRWQRIRALQMDNGGELLLQKFKVY